MILFKFPANWKWPCVRGLFRNSKGCFAVHTHTSCSSMLQNVVQLELLCKQTKRLKMTEIKSMLHSGTRRTLEELKTARQLHFTRLLQYEINYFQSYSAGCLFLKICGWEMKCSVQRVWNVSAQIVWQSKMWESSGLFPVWRREKESNTNKSMRRIKA